MSNATETRTYTDDDGTPRTITVTYFGASDVLQISERTSPTEGQTLEGQTLLLDYNGARALVAALASVADQRAELSNAGER